MEKSIYRSVLQGLLQITGVGLRLATVPIFFPESLMAWIHERLGLGSFPQSSITMYLARSTSLLYAVHGAIILYTAIHMDDLKRLIPILAGLHLVIGSVMLGIDLSAKMPLYWTVSEGPGVASMGILMFWLYHKANTIRKP